MSLNARSVMFSIEDRKVFLCYGSFRAEICEDIEDIEDWTQTAIEQLINIRDEIKENYGWESEASDE